MSDTHCKAGAAAARQAEALSEFLNQFGDGMLLDDIGPHLTCDNANSLAELFRAYGDEDTAAYVIKAHAWGDEEGEGDGDGDDPEHLKVKAQMIAEQGKR